MNRILVIWVSVPACSTSEEFQPSMPTHSDAKKLPSLGAFGLGTVHCPPTKRYGLFAGATAAPDQFDEVAFDTSRWATLLRLARPVPPWRIGPWVMFSWCSNSGAIHSRVRPTTRSHNCAKPGSVLAFGRRGRR